jgi:hypothetical protein
MLAPNDVSGANATRIFARDSQKKEPMHTSDPIRVLRIALRLSLGTAFLSAVADRFGWWAPFGQGSWGSIGAYADYVHQLVPFASGWILTVLVWVATVFGTSMAISLGVASPLGYSVFSAASAAAAYAIPGATSPPHASDTTQHSNPTLKGSS